MLADIYCCLGFVCPIGILGLFAGKPVDVRLLIGMIGQAIGSE